MARFYSPSIIFIDEIDSLVSRKSNSDSDVNSKVKSQILAELDGVSSVKGKIQIKNEVVNINEYYLWEQQIILGI